MRTLTMLGFPAQLRKVEGELLHQVRQAEIEFKQAAPEQKEQAGEKYRRALDRFSRLILDRRSPTDFSLQS
jgi:hypothetical protein